MILVSQLNLMSVRVSSKVEKHSKIIPEICNFQLIKAIIAIIIIFSLRLYFYEKSFN
jgi:hypothetical protein